jgi:site-specific DNA recombinase
MTLTIDAPIATTVRRVATYARVSSGDQAERGTIATQVDELERRVRYTDGIAIVGRFVDDGVSGTIPVAERPDGRRLMALAARGAIDEVWVYKVDRLGRDAIDLLSLRRRLETLGVRLVSLVEGEQAALPFDLQAVVADYARVEFLRRSADGMARAAREGRYWAASRRTATASRATRVVPGWCRTSG